MKNVFYKTIDGKEYNTAKGGVLQLRLIKSKISYLMKKILDTE